MVNHEYTNKGKLKDGYCYNIPCSIHKKTKGVYIGNKLCCQNCGNEFGKDKGVVKIDRGDNE